jgi:hypothetical protein
MPADTPGVVMTDQFGQPPQYGASGYPQAPYPVVRNSQDAVIALVAAIASWVICPIVPAIIALVYASRAEQAIAASGGALTGQGMVTGARVIAWVHLALAAVFAVVAVVLIVAFLR